MEPLKSTLSDIAQIAIGALICLWLALRQAAIAVGVVILFAIVGAAAFLEWLWQGSPARRPRQS